MTFLPIVSRELRVAARRRGTYWTRTAVALAAVVIGVFFYFISLGAKSHILAERIFEGLVVLAVIYCLASGRRSTADCLSVEKREGTLGLLFLTDLKGYDVVFGKLAATSLTGFYGLLAVLPILAVPLLIGGITSGEFWRTVLVLVNTFLFSLAIGIFVSALSHDAHKARGANFVLLVLFIGALPACAGAITYFSPSHRLVPELMFSCPIYSLSLCSDFRYPWEKGHFWWSVGVVHGLTWLLLGLASWIVPRSWQDKTPGAATSRWRERRRAWTYGNAAKRSAFRKRLLELNAFYWLAARAQFKPVMVWTVLASMVGWWIWQWANNPHWNNDALDSTNAAVAVILSFALKLWIAIEAGQRLAEDQKAGAFELLLTTPLTVRDILRGQLMALRRQFLKPTLVVLAAGAVFMVMALRHSPQDAATIQTLWLGGPIMLAADMIALSWVAMSVALTSRSANHATISTVFRILILPWLVMWVVASVTHAVANTVGGGNEPGWKYYFAWWLGLGIAADLIFGLTAWRKLRSHFRHLAAERFSPRSTRLAWRLVPRHTPAVPNRAKPQLIP